MSDELNATNDLDLEYKDVVKSPTDSTTATVEVPDKYKGKSLDDLINMHVNAEKLIARQGNDLGQLRRTLDAQTSVLDRVIAPVQQTEKKPLEVTPEKLLNDPLNTVNDVVGAHPAVQANQQRLNQMEMQVRETQFSQAHKSYKDDVQNPEFQDWVMKSPVRQKLLVSLHNYNFDAGHELWELWDEHRTAKTAAEAARTARVGAASTVRAGAGEPSAKPILSRTKLAELQMRAMSGDAVAKQKWEDPSFQAMRLEAYSEGRIR